MVFPVVMYRSERWTIKKAKQGRINAFELWSWRRLLRVSWTARKSNQSILKEINCEFSLEELMLKLQYFDYLMGRANSLEKTLMLGKIEGNRRSGWQRMRCLDRITNWMDMNLSKLWETVKVCCSPWGRKESDRTKHLNNNNNLWQRRQEYTMRKKDSSVGAAGKSGKLLLNEWNENIFYAVHKNKLKIYWRPKCKTTDHKAPRRRHRQNTLWHK